jgi:hypothetical protein
MREDDMPDLTLGSAATLVEAAASAVTLVIALLVFREARRIRKADGIFRLNQAWNEFGTAVSQFHRGTRIEAFLTGKEVAPQSGPMKSADDLTLIESFLVMSMFNVVSSEYSAFCADAIEERYVLNSMGMTHEILRRNRAWIFEFLRKYGYEDSFIECLRIVERLGADPEQLRPALRAEFRAAPRRSKRGSGGSGPAA